MRYQSNSYCQEPSSCPQGPNWKRNYVVPMQVLALGFSRTGTNSLKLALEALGYIRTNHGWDAFSTSEELDFWIAAIKAKFYGEGALYGPEEWDRVLGDCLTGRCRDVPQILFAAELIAAYPDAKIVLNTRDSDSLFNIWLYPELAGKYDVLMHLVYTILFNTPAARVTEKIAKAQFLEHYDAVRRVTPRERLLGYEVKEGWGPLCEFLGKESSATDFPRVNDKEEFERTSSAWRFLVRRAGAKYSAGLIIMAALVTWGLLICHLSQEM
ncbi:efflux pump antibiotic resistance protein [Mycena crocata]|nr:efflux pump antibiotic resistance protein [Mycena crocata]